MIKFIDKEDLVYKIGFFLINPFFGIILAFSKIKSFSSYIIFFLFCILFGVSFSVPSGRTIDYTGDGAVYRERFERIAKYDNKEFNELLSNYTKFNEGEKDFYVTALSFLVSRFTDNYHWVFGVYAFVFSFFLLRSLHFLTRERKFDNSIYCFLLALMFILSNSIFNINGVRFWTASWIGVYSIFQIFLNDSKRYFFLAAFTPFIHVSFFAFFFVLILAYFSKSLERFWFSMFLLSFLVSSFANEFIVAIEGYFPDFIGRTIRLYTDPEIIAQKQGDIVWYAVLFNYFILFVINTTIFLFYKNRHRIIISTRKNSLYLFLIVWMTFVNFSMTIPSLGGRFLQLSVPIIAYLWLMLLDNRKYVVWLAMFFIAFSFSYLYQLRLILKVTEVDLYIYSPIYTFYNYLFS